MSFHRLLAAGSVLLCLACSREPAGVPPSATLQLAPDLHAQSIVWDLQLINNGGAWKMIRAFAINDSNVVVGGATIGPSDHDTKAWRWRTGIFTYLNPPNESRSVAHGINLAGEIVGWFTPCGVSLAYLDPYSPCVDAHGNHWTWEATGFFRSSSGQYQLLPTIGEPWNESAAAMDINDSGQVVVEEVNVGNGKTFSYRGRLTIAGHWIFTKLGSSVEAERDYYAKVAAINNVGTAVGNTGGWYGFLWPGSAATILQPNTTYQSDCIADINDSNASVGVIGGMVTFFGWKSILPSSGNCYSEPPRISNAGRLVATTKNATGNLIPFTWKAGVLEYLPLPPGATSGTATAVNTCGVVAGSVRYPGINKDVIVLWRRLDGRAFVCD